MIDENGDTATGSDTPNRCVALNLRKTARIVSQAYETELRPTGLRVTQFSLLAMLEGQPPMRVAELAGKLVMDRTTLSRNLRPLEKRNLVRISVGNDARVHEISLSSAGQAALRNALPHWRRAQRSLVKALGDNRYSRLLNDLAATRDIAQAAPDTE